MFEYVSPVVWATDWPLSYNWFWLCALWGASSQAPTESKRMKQMNIAPSPLWIGCPAWPVYIHKCGQSGQDRNSHDFQDVVLFRKVWFIEMTWRDVIYCFPKVNDYLEEVLPIPTKVHVIQGVSSMGFNHEKLLLKIMISKSLLHWWVPRVCALLSMV